MALEDARTAFGGRIEGAFAPDFEPVARTFAENFATYGELGASACIELGDRGSQYLSIRYTERLAEAGFNASVGSVGDSYDNALAETINGLYKAEVIHKNGPWKGLDDVERATLTWVEWFNNRRLLRPIGDVPPAEYEMLYYQTESSEAA